MFNLTIKEYLDTIQNLKIDDFIIFYFTVYFFVVLVQRALDFKFDVGKFRSNPKILASLILVQLFSFLNQRVDASFISADHNIQIVFLALVFAILVFLFMKIMSPQYGFIFFVVLFFHHRDARARRDERIKNGEFVVTNFEAISKSAQHVRGTSRLDGKELIINLYICIVLVVAYSQYSLLVGGMMAFASSILLQPILLKFDSYVSRYETFSKYELVVPIVVDEN